MAKDVKPSLYFGPGYVLDATNHVLKLNTSSAASNKTLLQLTDAQGHATTGSAEQVMLALCHMMYEAFRAQEATDNTPAKMSAQKDGNPNAETGGWDVGFTFRFTYTETGCVWTAVPEP